MVASYGQVWQAEHLNLINDVLLDISEGKVKRQMIFAPPRHGKSTMVSHYFPAWYLGRFPQKRVILTSFEADQAREFGRKARDVLDEFGPWVFGIKVRAISSAAHRWNLLALNQQGLWVPVKGGMNTASVRGPLTGKGAHVLVIDDPIKDEAMALSEAYQRSNYEWYRATAYPRLESGGAVVLMHTRWHEQDLAGKLLADEGTIEEGGLWRVLKLPALAEDEAVTGEPDPLGREPGQALWPEMFDEEALEDRRITLQSWFFAEFQQRPQPASGGTFKSEWIRYFYEDEIGYDTWYYLDDGENSRRFSANNCWHFCTLDLAVGQEAQHDWTVAQIWCVTPDGDLLLLHQERARVEGPDHLPMIRRLKREWNLAFIGIEKVAYQTSLIQAAKREGMPVIELIPDKAKEIRAIPAASMMSTGRIFFRAGADYVDGLIHELLSFPRGRFDDQVDALAYAAREMLLRFSGGRAREAGESAENTGPYGPVQDQPYAPL